MVKSVVCPVMEINQKQDPEQAGKIRGINADGGDVLTDNRRLEALLQRSCSKKADVRRARELAGISYKLRSASDVVVTRPLGLAENKDQLNIGFLADGWKELVDVDAKVMTSLFLTLSVSFCPTKSNARASR